MDTVGVGGRSVRSGEREKIFSTSRLQSDAEVSACSNGHKAAQPRQPAWPCQLSRLPRMVLLPWSRVGLSGHTSMSGLKGASVLSCSCLQSLQGLLLPRASGYVWKEVCRNLGRVQTENQVRWCCHTAPAAVLRKVRSCGHFTMFYFSEPCNNRSGSLHLNCFYWIEQN